MGNGDYLAGRASYIPGRNNVPERNGIEYFTARTNAWGSGARSYVPQASGSASYEFALAAYKFARKAREATTKPSYTGGGGGTGGGTGLGDSRGAVMRV